MIETHALTKRYGRFTALDHCDLAIERGEVFGLLGPNGSGKTTLLRLLLGFLRPSAGHATLDQLDCHRHGKAVRAKVAYLPGDARLFRNMRGRDVLRFFCDVRRDADFDRALALAERLDVELDRTVAFLSTGTRQKLALAAVLAADTPVLVLDEPTANLDPTIRAEVIALVLEAKRAGRTVIFSSHVLDEVEAACDRVAILRAGKLAHLQTTRELRAVHVVRATFHGEAPSPPAGELSAVAVFRPVGEALEIECPGGLAPVLRWLADQPVAEVHVDRVGLASVYHRFHPPRDGRCAR